MSSDSVIETHDLSKRYGDFQAVDRLSFSARRDRITGFLGRNGAGKSTTIKMLLGMVAPTSGDGRVLGHPIDDPGESLLIRRRIAYVGEDKGLYSYMTVSQLIRFTRSFYLDWRPDVERQLLHEFELPPRRKVKALSKGMRTKLALLLALARQPAILILDEPTEGLDPVSIDALLQALVARSGQPTAIFFSSHQLGEVERIADDIVMIDRGRVVLAGALDDIQDQYRSIVAGFASEPAADAFQMPGVERVRISGRQVTILASSNADEVIRRVESLGAVSVDATPLSLRELFLDKVRGDR
ncbi:MAG: ABC transporter ATP-binding protein [Gemmatimonadales bacterium]